MKNLIIIIIATILLASCAAAPVQKTEAPAQVISSDQIEIEDPVDQAVAVGVGSPGQASAGGPEIYDSSEDVPAENNETEDLTTEPDSENTMGEKIKDSAATTGQFLLQILLWGIESIPDFIAAGAIW